VRKGEVIFVNALSLIFGVPLGTPELLELKFFVYHNTSYLFDYFLNYILYKNPPWGLYIMIAINSHSEGRSR